MKTYSAVAFTLALSLASPAFTQPPMDMSEHHADMEASEASNGMSGVLGGYAMSREASGTSWQPDATQHMGEHTQRGNWLTMTHAMLNGVYDWQGGPRGDEKLFLSGMFMGSAQREIGARGTVNLRAMLSPDPFMGKRGYPLLLAAGETADGKTLLTDRQHPHDLFMELSGSYSQRLSANDSVFVYAGLPGEPAFGPPAFMHRLSTMDSPEAPITHHWFDSTHITFGVITAGWTHDNWKIEGSGFKGREPDENRYDIEAPKIDSAAVRVSWNPTKRLALQASWAHLASPEQLDPTEDETRWSGSAIYTTPFGEDGWWSTTFAVGAKDHHGDNLGAAALESAIHPNKRWSVFARAEGLETGELSGAGIQKVQKASIGVIRDFALADNVTFGVGALGSRNWVPSDVAASYGGDRAGAMAFVRLKFGG